MAQPLTRTSLSHRTRKILSKNIFFPKSPLGPTQPAWDFIKANNSTVQIHSWINPMPITQWQMSFNQTAGRRPSARLASSETFNSRLSVTPWKKSQQCIILQLFESFYGYCLIFSVSLFSKSLLFYSFSLACNRSPSRQLVISSQFKQRRGIVKIFVRHSPNPSEF